MTSQARAAYNGAKATRSVSNQARAGPRPEYPTTLGLVTDSVVVHAVEPASTWAPALARPKACQPVTISITLASLAAPGPPWRSAGDPAVQAAGAIDSRTAAWPWRTRYAAASANPTTRSRARRRTAGQLSGG